MSTSRIPVHLNVPPALKARWVRESRVLGMRLGDWIIERVNRQMPAIKITESLAGQYHGAGWALAAVAGGQIVALRYIVDVAPPEVADKIADGGPHARMLVRAWLGTDDAGPVIRELQAIGDLTVGMCSCWEFVEH